MRKNLTKEKKMSVLNTITQIASIVYKTAQVVESGAKIYELCKKQGPLDRKEKIELVTEIVFGIFQASDVVVGGCRMMTSNTQNAHLLKNIQILTTTGVGLSETAKVVIPMTRHEKIPPALWGNLVGVVLFGVSDVAHVCASTPQYSAKVHSNYENVENVARAAGCAILLISKKDAIKNSTFVIVKWVKRHFRKEQSWEQKWSEPNKATSISEKPLPSIVLPDLTTKENIEKNYTQLITDVKDWENLKTIPANLFADSVLQTFVCKISGTCIRFIVRPIDVYSGIYYEQAAIENWLNTNPQKIPPGWPPNIEFNAANIEEDKSLQHQINVRLKKISQEFQDIIQKYDVKI